MRKTRILLILLALLIILYGLLYRETVKVQENIGKLKKTLDILKIQQTSLEHQISILENPKRIEELARNKYKMIEPKVVIFINED